jgi:hypothetical protein
MISSNGILEGRQVVAGWAVPELCKCPIEHQGDQSEAGNYSQRESQKKIQALHDAHGNTGRPAFGGEIRTPAQQRVRRSSVMPIRFFLEPDHAFSPNEVKILVDAFEDTLRALNLTNREDPLTTRVAKVIIGLAKDGERDPARLRDLALKFVRRE